MKKIVLIAFVLVSFLSVSAQYTEIINSKRPGFSESPYSVGTKALQLEAGGFYQDNIESSNLYQIGDLYGGRVFLRYSNFLERLELNLDTKYTFENRIFHNVFTSKLNTVSGLSKLTLGAKYLVYNSVYTDKSKEIRSRKKRFAFDWKRLIPSVGVYAGWNSNYINTEFQAEKMSFKAAVLFQNDINERFVVLTNLSVDNIMLDYMEYSYIITSTSALSERWSVFGEHQGVFTEIRDSEFQFGGGFAYLYSKDIQLDIAARTSLIQNKFSTYYISLGGSYRLDRHTKKKKKGLLEGTREPFFKRLFKKDKNKKRSSKKPKYKKVRTKKRRMKKSKGPSFFNDKKKKKKKRGRKKRKKSNKK